MGALRPSRRNLSVDVRIGVTQAPREIEVELGDDVDVDKLAKQIEKTLSDESAVLWLSDRRGRRFGIPAAKIAYVEIGSPTEERRVGFGAQVVR
jgi:hypothetical protein